MRGANPCPLLSFDFYFCRFNIQKKPSLLRVFLL
nr:MAG TPA: hypothetical protein [Bacteriophage sp.]